MKYALYLNFKKEFSIMYVHHHILKSLDTSFKTISKWIGYYNA